jgi:hypothetical protein
LVPQQWATSVIWLGALSVTTCGRGLVSSPPTKPGAAENNDNAPKAPLRRLAIYPPPNGECPTKLKVSSARPLDFAHRYATVGRGKMEFLMAQPLGKMIVVAAFDEDDEGNLVQSNN